MSKESPIKIKPLPVGLEFQKRYPPNTNADERRYLELQDQKNKGQITERRVIDADGKDIGFEWVDSSGKVVLFEHQAAGRKRSREHHKTWDAAQKTQARRSIRRQIVPEDKFKTLGALRPKTPDEGIDGPIIRKEVLDPEFRILTRDLPRSFQKKK